MLTQFHKCNAWVESVVNGCEQFYSYNTHVATTYRYKREIPVNGILTYQSFLLAFIAPNATHISPTTTRQLSRYLTEKVAYGNTYVSAATIRQDLQRAGTFSFVDYGRSVAGLHVLAWLNANPTSSGNVLTYGGWSSEDLYKAKCFLTDNGWS